MVSEASRQQEDIEYIRDRVLRKFPLLGVTMASLKTVANDQVGTAATDGKTVYYSPKFFNQMSDDEKTFLYAHEVMHVAFNHILRSKGRQQRLWNIATDAVINQILKNEELPMIDGGVDMAEAVNRSAEEMYDKLLKEQQDKKEKNQQQKDQQGQQSQPQQQEGQQGPESQSQQQEGQQGPESQSQQQEGEQGQQSQLQQQNEGNGQTAENQDAGGEDENAQAGHDNHQIWQKAVEEAEKEQQRQQEAQNRPSKGQSLLDKLKDLLSKKSPEDSKAPQEKGEKQAGEQGEAQRSKGEESAYEQNFAADNRQERQKQAEQVRRMLERQKNETMKTKVEADGHSFGPVGEAKAVLDWKKLLKKSVEEEEDRWSYRRSGADNDYMARVEELEDENKSETEVMLDVSGSVDEAMLKEFLRQLKPILKNSKLKVGCFDHRLFEFQEIKNNKDIDQFRINGGGGTNIDLAVRAFSKKKEVNKIVFTDGESNDMPRSDLKNVNVIWLIYDNKNFHPVCGKVIYVDKQQIRQNFMQLGRNARGSR